MKRRCSEAARCALGTTALAALLALPATAFGQRGIDAELFHPALDSYGIFSVDRSETSPQWDFGFKLYMNYAHHPLRLAMFDETKNMPAVQTIMNRQIAINLGAHLGLTDWLEFVLDIPISSQDFSAAYGTNGSAATWPIERTGFYAAQPFTNVPPPDAAALDTRLGFKARMLRERGFGLGVAAVATLPFGDDSAFLGDSGFTFRPEFIADFTRGGVTIALNAGAIIRSETIVLDPHDVVIRAPKPRVLLDVGNELTWSAGVAYRFAQYVGVGAEAYGYVPLAYASKNVGDAPKDYTADVIGGLQFFPGKSVILAVGAGANVLSSAARHDDFRVFAGLSWALSEGRKGQIAAGSLDTDGDGIADTQDLCPNDPEDKDGFEDEDGCPDLDNDQDGVPDKADKCPNDPEDRDNFEDEDGCPDPDNDQDGIPDAQDKCPSEPEDRDGFQDDDGCPDLDNDGDGIADAKDKCPNEPETKNGVDDEDGCPDSGGQVQIAGDKIELPDNIQFESGRATIASRSEALVGRIADKINGNPQVKRIRIEGHTDDIGSQKRNQELSQERAEAVRDALIKRGVEASRLQAVGYGDTRPLDRGRTAAARAKNRRVEFIIVEQ